jgi:hypothetical protein|tara:strand:+ start:805 stop:939 length:135 start_codon:yes stop_codon:yes gene_type:complete
MRSFTKKGFVKPKMSDDKELIERWLSDGWTEVGVKEKPKTKKTK